MTPILSVSDFNQLINNVLNNVGEVVVEGEISELKVSQGKWVFGTIKDRGASVEIFGVAFQLRNLNSLSEGMLVKVYGTPRLYEKTGRFSISASQIVPSGEGALQIAFEKLKRQLAEEGIFSVERKRPLPQFPEKIGLITAKGSQAYADFVKVLQERIGGIDILFYPVQVQGQDSPTSLLQSLKYFNTQHPDLDLIVMTRGGGSLEDLAAFNDEQVVRAVFSSNIPVVAGIGHEENISLVELAADLRASTPSNAAELISRERNELSNSIDATLQQFSSHLLQNIKLKQQFIQSTLYQANNFMQQRSELTKQALPRFLTSARSWQQQQLANVTLLEKTLETLDYRKTLDRGFSIIESNGTVVRSIADVSPEDRVTLTLKDGSISSTVNEINKN